MHLYLNALSPSESRGPSVQPHQARTSRAARCWSLLALTVLTVSLAGCSLWQPQAADSYEAQVRRIAGPYVFDLVAWEVRAVAAQTVKWATVERVGPASSEARALVLQYLALTNHIGRIQDELERAHASAPCPGQQQEEAAALEHRLAALRQLQAVRRPLVERILESQVESVIAEEGLGWLGTSLPPLAFVFTEPPNYLVLSPRAEIRLRMGVYLVPELPLQEIELLEARLEAELPNTSALISATGGFSTWPTMIVDRASLAWILSTIAHEWTHLYLEPFPLGRNYHASPDLTAINETVAQIVGDEIGAEALRRYYPALAPEDRVATQLSEQVETSAEDEPGFDYNREMRLTRETVDALLARGLVAEAEAYMEERRQVFLRNGYVVRKLNQAYFAFHGSYRTGPAAPKKDPIAPRLLSLRAETASLRQFLLEVRDMSSLDDLLQRVPGPAAQEPVPLLLFARGATRSRGALTAQQR